ncbi:MAG: metal-sensing transcriptional repressor [Thomasclavelia sp.]
MRKCMDADNLHRRLKKIIGQVQAIDIMVDEDVPCEDVLAQINVKVSLAQGWTGCLRRAYQTLCA